MNPQVAVAQWYGPAPKLREQPHQPVKPQPFNCVATSTLVAILDGDLDPREAAAYELNARCRNMRGDYVGLAQSNIEYGAWKGDSE